MNKIDDTITNKLVETCVSQMSENNVGVMQWNVENNPKNEHQQKGLSRKKEIPLKSNEGG